MSDRWPCLLYHDLDSGERPSRKTDPAGLDTVLDISDFAGHLARLSERGYEITSHAGLTSASSRRRPVVVTFDDGDESAHRLALPALREHRATATFYIVSGWVGTPGYLNEEQVRDLARAGMEIGSHTVSHRFLSDLDDHEIRYELSASRDALRSLAGQAIRSVAWPGGHHDTRVVRIAREVGYDNAMSCLVGTNDADTDAFHLRRIELRRDTSADALESAMAPGGILLASWAEALKSRVRGIVGLENYRALRRRLYRFYPLRR